MSRKTVSFVSILLIASVLFTACSDSGPEPGFDVTGLWVEQGGDCTLEFTEAGGYVLDFEPALSDGTTHFEGKTYKRVDNGHLTFTVLMGRATLEIIEVEATITSSNVVRFNLDGKTYSFIRSEG